MRVQPILYTALALLVLLPAANAQPVLTPTPVSTGATTNAEWGAYTVTNSVEVGYRFTSVAGDANLFRSVENYDNGLRLFGGSFTANSKDGRGRLFDTIAINTSGLFNDPYGMANVRIEKNHLYRYDSTWRRHEYFNSARLNGAGGTQKETTRIIQDHELGITATKWATLVLGYSRNRESGPEYTYYETYIGGLARSLLPIQRDTRRDFNDYRLGGDFKFAGFLLSLSHRWQYYKDDSSIVPLAPGQPYALDYLRNLPFDPSFELTYPQAASSYSRSQPMHARTGAWFGALNRTEKYWALTARMSYSKADSDSVYFERQSGLSQAASNSVPTGDGRFLTGANSGYGPFANAFTYMPGNARHPFMAGDLSLTFYPTTKLTIVNSMSVQSNRYDGTGNELRVLDTGAAAVNRFWSFHIGTGRVSDAVDVNYKVNKWLGLNAEYRYTSRFIDNNLVRTGTTNGRDVNSARNHLNTGTLGFRLRPIRPLSLSVDGTVGRDNGPENPTSPAHFHNIRARVDYNLRKVRFGGTYRQNYNLNAPPSVFSSSTGQLVVGASLDYYSYHARDLSLNTSFDATSRLSFDVSYSKMHLDTLANLWAELVPAGSTTITSVSVRGYISQYISNLHTLSVIGRYTFGRGSFQAGYNISRDTGDGRGAQNLGLTNLGAAYTASWSTFPMTYQTPIARLSIKLSPRLQWNGGWEFYGYNQKFSYFGYQPYYRANTGYTSLSLSF